MLQKLETVLKNSKVYQLEECTIDSLMRMECDQISCISCTGCLYDLCGIKEEGIICGVEVKDDLCGVV